MPPSSQDAIKLRVATDLANAMEVAWNRASGDDFGACFAEDADFITIRGEHLRSRGVIVIAHQDIFDTIYKGSTIHHTVTAARTIASDAVLVHLSSELDAPHGPLAGTNRSAISFLAVRLVDAWRIAAFHNTRVASGTSSVPRKTV